MEWPNLVHKERTLLKEALQEEQRKNGLHSMG